MLKRWKLIHVVGDPMNVFMLLAVPATRTAFVLKQPQKLVQIAKEPLPCVLIKVAAEIIVSTRRVVVRLSAHWPNLEYFQRVCQNLASITSTPSPTTS